MESENSFESWGEWQRRNRLERGWSQVDLTVRTGVGQGELSKYETGKAIPEAITMQKIGRAFGENPPLLSLVMGRYLASLLHTGDDLDTFALGISA